MRRKTTSERLTRVAVNWWKADLEKHAAKYSALEASLVIHVPCSEGVELWYLKHRTPAQQRQC